MYSSVLLFFSGSDLMVIMFIALLLFGGEKLPELARGLGKGIRDFKDASEGVKREINNQINSYEEKKAEETAANATPVTPQAALPPAEEHITSGTTVDTEETHSGVANTMPFAESNNITADRHPHETPLNPQGEPTEASAEPVKTTHE
ncbi:MAG: twin-arginine translocase TatA/TatE family subunit [Sphingobacteriales bacterium]